MSWGGQKCSPPPKQKASKLIFLRNITYNSDLLIASVWIQLQVRTENHIPHDLEIFFYGKSASKYLKIPSFNTRAVSDQLCNSPTSAVCKDANYQLNRLRFSWFSFYLEFDIVEVQTIRI